MPPTPMTERGSQRLGVGQLRPRPLRSTWGRLAVWAAAESCLKPLWLEHPVHTGDRELIWAIRLPACV